MDRKSSARRAIEINNKTIARITGKLHLLVAIQFLGRDDCNKGCDDCSVMIKFCFESLWMLMLTVNDEEGKQQKVNVTITICATTPQTKHITVYVSTRKDRF